MARPTISKYSGRYSIPKTTIENAIKLPTRRCILFSLPRNPDINIVVTVRGIIASDNKGISSTVSAYSGNANRITSGATKIPSNAKPIDATIAIIFICFVEEPLESFGSVYLNIICGKIKNNPTTWRPRK